MEGKGWMRAVAELLERKKSRLRGCVLLLLGCMAVCLCLRTQPEALPDVQTTERGEAALAGMTVALDPGHGGYDGGARARDSGRWEKDINLEIALAVEKELAAQGARVILTRREDVCLCGEGTTATKARKREDLQQRVNIALENQADVFLSIHMNEYRSRSESGPQVFYQRGGDAGRLLAGVLQKHLIAGLKPKKERTAMAGNYYVLRSRLPSALVECGFISNSAEEKLLLSPDYQRKIAEAIASGLAEYRTLSGLTQQGGAQSALPDVTR